MRLTRLLPLALALGLPFAATAADPVRVNAADLHLEALRPAAMTYLVYFHGAAGSGAKRAMLATSTVKRERPGGSTPG